MIIGERLKGFIKRHGFTAKSFAEAVGVSEPMVYKYYKMDNIDTQTLMKWAEIFHVPMMIFIDDDMYNKYISPKIEKGTTEQDLKSIRQEDVPLINYTTGVPYYNVDFIGGFDMVLNDQTITPEYLIDFKKYNEADCWCNVTGHSMEPEITHGDMIALKKIEDMSFLPFGEVYAIVTKNDMRTIKRLGPASTPDNYSLVPTNKSPEYGIQELPKSMIRIVFQVLGCMKRL